jgi:hypothetical protein
MGSPDFSQGSRLPNEGESHQPTRAVGPASRRLQRQGYLVFLNRAANDGCQLHAVAHIATRFQYVGE